MLEAQSDVKGAGERGNCCIVLKICQNCNFKQPCRSYTYQVQTRTQPNRVVVQHAKEAAP